MKAYAAQDFVDSIGVNGHLHYDPTPYKKNFDDVIKPKLAELGVKHVRDGAITWSGWSKDYGVNHLKELGALGIKLNLMISAKAPWGDETRFAELPKLAEYLGNVASFEGVNEPDIQNWLKDWPIETRRLQEELYKAVAPLGLPVLAPSVVWSPAKLGDISDICDYGNMHCYAAANRPSGPLTADLKAKSVCWPKFPPVVTECGYHNAVSTKNSHKPQSEKDAGTYAPILFLEHFRRGFPRSYWYEFIDQYPDEGKTEPEKNFGLLRHDGTAKPAFSNLKRLIRLMESNDGPQPDDLNITLAGPKSLRSLLLVRGDGVKLLALWRDMNVGITPELVTVKLPKPVFSYTVHPFDTASIQVTPIQTVSSPAWDHTTTFKVGDDGAPVAVTNRTVPRTLTEEIPGARELKLKLGADLTVIELPSW